MTYGIQDITNALYVQKGGIGGDFSTVKAACDYAATLTRNITNRVVIHVASGQYNEAAFTVPSYTTLMGSLESNFTAAGPTLIYRNGQSGDTSYITADLFAIFSNIYIQYTPPANLSNNMAVITCPSGAVNFFNTHVTAGAYNGTNTLTVIGVTGGFAMSASSLFASGSSAVGVNATSLSLFFDTVFRTSGTVVSKMVSVGDDTTFVNCAFDGWHNAFENYAGKVMIETQTGSTEVYLYNTPVDKRCLSGSGVVYDRGMTPQQLKTAITASSRDVAVASSLADRTFNAYTDGTIECDTVGGTFSVFLPPIADATLGQSFVVKILDNATGVTVDGNGANIDGAATFPDLLGTAWAAAVFYKNARSTWSVR